MARRLQRLAYPGAFVDLHRSVTRVLHEAALEGDLPPLCHQQLQADVDARLHALRQIVPASGLSGGAGRRGYRRGRPPALWPRCHLERGMPAGGPPPRSPGMTHLQRLEAQAWEVEGRRLAQMTEAA